MAVRIKSDKGATENGSRQLQCNGQTALPPIGIESIDRIIVFHHEGELTATARLRGSGIHGLHRPKAEGEAAVETANAELSGMLEIEASDAGMHLIGWLPHGVDDQVVARGAWRHKVIARPLSEYGLKPVERGALVLGYTAFNERKLRTGVRQLKVALAELGL